MSHHFCIVVEAVEDLPEQDQGHEEEVDSRQHCNPALQVLNQLLALVNPLVILLQVPLVEGRPGAFKEEPLHVVLEPLAEEDHFAGSPGQDQADGQKVLVDECHLGKK